MIFQVPITKDVAGNLIIDVVNTESTCKRTNKAKLRKYFKARGVPASEIKSVMKLMGFWGDQLGE